jgi:hypothetical protein
MFSTYTAAAAQVGSEEKLSQVVGNTEKKLAWVLMRPRHAARLRDAQTSIA